MSTEFKQAASIFGRTRVPLSLDDCMLTLVTGGSRSGKTAHALALAEAQPGRRAYVATCPRFNAEMDERIARHEAERRGRGWETIEEQLAVADCFAQLGDYRVVLLDCLTLWVNNLLYAEERVPAERSHLSEERMIASADELASAARAHGGHVILITNEVGLGIVPENALARRFRDLAGRCNQRVAAAADEVVLMVSGIAVPVKTRA